MSTWAGADDLVTGEAVAVELPGAGLGLRALSGLIDVVARTAALIAVGYGVSRFAAGLDEALVAGIALVTSVGVLVAWPTLVEAVSGGRTLGKRLTGLRTVRDDGGPPSVRHYLTRHLVGVVEVWLLFGAPALLAGAATRRTKRLGDLAAGTVVGRDRRRLTPPEPIAMPRDLAGWARTAQLGALPPELLRRARHLLRHGGQLDAGVHARLSGEIAGELGRFVAPAPPPGARATDVCRAVLARRSELDLERLERQERLRERFFESTTSPPEGADPSRP